MSDEPRARERGSDGSRAMADVAHDASDPGSWLCQNSSTRRRRSRIARVASGYALGPPASGAQYSCRREPCTGRSAWLPHIRFDSGRAARYLPPSIRQMKPTGRRAPGTPGRLRAPGGTGWDGLSPRLSLPLRC